MFGDLWSWWRLDAFDGEVGVSAIAAVMPAAVRAARTRGPVIMLVTSFVSREREGEVMREAPAPPSGAVDGGAGSRYPTIRKAVVAFVVPAPAMARAVTVSL